MHVEAWMFGKPVLHEGMFVGCIVVGDQMQNFALRRIATYALRWSARARKPVQPLREERTRKRAMRVWRALW